MVLSIGGIGYLAMQSVQGGLSKGEGLRQ